MALKEVHALSLSKKFLHKKVLPRYPEIALLMKRQALERYEIEVHQPVVSFVGLLLFDVDRTQKSVDWKYEQEERLQTDCYLGQSLV